MDKKGGAVTVGERLMTLRKEACLSQPVMAQKLGITQNAVWRYEHGMSLSSLPTSSTCPWTGLPEGRTSVKVSSIPA